jgi:hypothetical protein
MAQANKKGPSPQAYTMRGDFEKGGWKQAAFTFGLSREHFRKVYLKENPPVDITVPGPGQYEVKRNAVESSASRYSLRPKTAKDSSFQNPTRGFPGPGQYTQKASEGGPTGFIVNSKYKSGGCAVISRGGSRFDSSALKTSGAIPGPGNYALNRLEFNMKGNYPVSRFRNSGAPMFTKGKRDTNLETSATRKITPGPGTYRVQSDFGYYDVNNSLVVSRLSAR